jgi:methylmalonyl-CoA mutase cobalamin-binding subunit
LKAEEIKQRLSELNDELRAADVKGEICLYGGAVMCLVFDARPATKDVDAVFRPAQQIRQAAERVARSHDLREELLGQ